MVEKNEELSQLETKTDDLLSKVIESSDRADFRLNNNSRNKFIRQARKVSEDRLRYRVSDNKLLWKEVNEALIKEKGEVPVSIFDKGNVINSPKKFSKIFNQFFHN